MAVVKITHVNPDEAQLFPLWLFNACSFSLSAISFALSNANTDISDQNRSGMEKQVNPK